MKNKFLKYALAPLAVVLMFAFAAWNKEEEGRKVTITDSETGQAFEYTYAGNKSYQKIYSRDTLTSTTPDTIQIPWILASPFQYEFYMRLRKISGTPNTKMVLDSRTVTNGIWSPIDSVSCSGADSTKVHFRLRGTVAYASQYRIRFVRSGSHSLQRDVQLNIKPPNQ